MPAVKRLFLTCLFVALGGVLLLEPAAQAKRIGVGRSLIRPSKPRKRSTAQKGERATPNKSDNTGWSSLGKDGRQVKEKDTWSSWDSKASKKDSWSVDSRSSRNDVLSSKKEGGASRKDNWSSKSDTSSPKRASLDSGTPQRRARKPRNTY